MNPKANGQLQHDWAWLIAIYLFLGGVGGGAYVIAGLNHFVLETPDLSTRVGLWIAFPALAIGSLCLLADLGSPVKAILAGMKPGTSWMARGFWIISIFMLIAFVHLILVEYTTFSEAPENAGLMTALTVAGIVFGVATLAYTGILLGVSKGIPFWRTGIVPVVFTISALVTGHFALMIGIVIMGENAAGWAPLRTMAAEAAGLVVLEVLAILFFLQAAFKTPDPRESARRILRQRLFVLGYFILGLAAPLAVMVWSYAMTAQVLILDALDMITIGAILGLFGGLVLRWAILVSGTMPTWNMAGFEFRRIARPKEPRPEIGMMPPS